MFGLKSFFKKGNKKGGSRSQDIAEHSASEENHQAQEQTEAAQSQAAVFVQTPISAGLNENRSADGRFLTHQDGIPLATADWRDQVEWGWTMEGGVQNSACFGIVLENVNFAKNSGIDVAENEAEHSDQHPQQAQNAAQTQNVATQAVEHVAVKPVVKNFYAPAEEDVSVVEHWDDDLDSALFSTSVVGTLPTQQPAVASEPSETKTPEVPQAEVPQAEVPQAEVPQAEVPQAEVPQAEVPQAEVPQAEAPQAEAPQAEAPQAEAPQAEAPQAEVPQAEVPQAPSEKPVKSWLLRLKNGLTRTGNHFTSLVGLRQIDEALLEELEDALLMADCGVEATTYLIGALRQRWQKEGLKSADELRRALAGLFAELLQPLQKPLLVDAHQPFIVMMVGVNGAGKTTSIGKLTKYFQAQGKSVLLAAGDTFRAAAREQLASWGECNNVEVVTRQGADAAAVIYDAVTVARARKIDIVLADTAGRLPTQLNLMEEIAKVRRVIAKVEASGPHEVLLVLDGNVGQNALAQLKAFDEAVKVSGLIITKLDGTAKGGVVAAIARQHPKPLRFIGVGEAVDDLQPFVATEFVSALFAGKK